MFESFIFDSILLVEELNIYTVFFCVDIYVGMQVRFITWFCLVTLNRQF